MSYFLFIDESGNDHGASPYEVLAGISIEDRELWNFIRALQDAEIQHFGRRLSPGGLELKGKKLLKKSVFRYARAFPVLSPDDRTALTKVCLEKGDAQRADSTAPGLAGAELTALCQAKIAFVKKLLDLCAQFRVRAFASVVEPNAPSPEKNYLRKDYAYLFQRFYYYLEPKGENTMGVVVFDELERSQAHILVNQMARYFTDTYRGRIRSSRVIPEPFFVHSDLTTAIQVADIIAYIISWNLRFTDDMTKDKREDLDDFGQMVLDIRHRARVDDYPLWSFAYIDDLRPRGDRD